MRDSEETLEKKRCKKFAGISEIASGWRPRWVWTPFPLQKIPPDSITRAKHRLEIPAIDRPGQTHIPMPPGRPYDFSIFKQAEAQGISSIASATWARYESTWAIPLKGLAHCTSAESSRGPAVYKELKQCVKILRKGYGWLGVMGRNF